MIGGTAITSGAQKPSSLWRRTNTSGSTPAGSATGAHVIWRQAAPLSLRKPASPKFTAEKQECYLFDLSGKSLKPGNELIAIIRNIPELLMILPAKSSRQKKLV